MDEEAGNKKQKWAGDKIETRMLKDCLKEGVVERKGAEKARKESLRRKKITARKDRNTVGKRKVTVQEKEEDGRRNKTNS